VCVDCRHQQRRERGDQKGVIRGKKDEEMQVGDMLGAVRSPSSRSEVIVKPIQKDHGYAIVMNERGGRERGKWER
jgi:hypothetical protein